MTRLRRRWLTVDGCRIHLRHATPASGTGGSQPIVLVHGFIISSRYMRPLARVLADRGRSSLAPDLPGYGHSDGHGVTPTIDELAAWLERIIEASGVRGRVTVIGNSMGCQVAVRLAVANPDRVERLVLVGPTFDPGASLPRHALRLLRDMPRERLDLWGLHVPDYVRAGPRRVVSTLRGAWDHRIETELPRVRAPVLVVRGERDPIVPAAWGRHAAELAPRGAFLELPGAPHAANYSTPAPLVAAIEPFLA